VSRWETIGQSRRIVTYTRVRVDQQILGKNEGELWVRTLGGHVDKIGQVVEGEAQLSIGTRTLVFLLRSDDGVLHVTALAQGHYPLAKDAGGTERLLKSPHSSLLVGNAPSAVKQLVGRSLSDAIALVHEAAR
jgi:hypothetical protein